MSPPDRSLEAPATSGEDVISPWALTGDRTLELLHVDPDRGLNDVDVVDRIRQFGRNELDVAVPTPRWRRFLDQFDDPLVLLLVVAIAISLVAWVSAGTSGSPLEALVIAAIVLLNACVGYWQEARAIKAVQALENLTATRSTVLRNSEIRRIASAELVPGDVLDLFEGDAIGADCRLIDAASLRVAEASLTGESTAVRKDVARLDRQTELADRSNMVFNGTGVASGHGRAVVVATGMSTEIGRIATMLDSALEERTPLQREIDRLGKLLGIAVLLLTSIVVGAILLTSNISSMADVLDALLVGVSLAVAAVPEGLPAILTVVLALGVQRMAGHNAVVKKLLSVETLGSASVICSDKTGTLTFNEMTIVRVVTGSVNVEIAGIGTNDVATVVQDGVPLTNESSLHEVALVINAGSLANNASLSLDEAGSWQAVGDPTEIAFLIAERRLGLSERRNGRFLRVGEVPFESERKLMTTIDRDLDPLRDSRATNVRSTDDAESAPNSELIVVTKGAPDVLIERCTREQVAGEVVVLTAQRRLEIGAMVDELADSAFRTLAVAYRRVPPAPQPFDESIEQSLVHLGIVGIVDPPRPEAAEAIADATRAGIRVVMITGDHPRTAVRIGEQLGLQNTNDRGLSGRDLSALDESEFALAVEENSVFARVAPDHKLRIVRTLQEHGHIVAMTGDGVNDAPALKQADIGVAMGINGTEVSKEASDVILTDDNFATILHAVREGREIFADIRKFLRYLLASNTGEVLVMFVGVLGAGLIGLENASDGLAVPLLATQILWINLLTDSALALALGVDPAIEDTMDRPPRKMNDRLIDRSMIVTIALVGTVSALVGLIALDLELEGGLLGGSGGLEAARTMLFTTVVLAQVFNAFNSRSDLVSAFVRPFDNPLLWAAAAVTVAMQILVVHLAFLNRAFDTVPLDTRQWGICIALSSAVLFADEIRKVVQRSICRRRETGRLNSATVDI